VEPAIENPGDEREYPVCCGAKRNGRAETELGHQEKRHQQSADPRADRIHNVEPPDRDAETLVRTVDKLPQHRKRSPHAECRDEQRNKRRRSSRQG
jgi:hypothetical protein